MERIRAPRGNRQAIVFPDRNRIPALIELNRSQIASPRTPSWIQDLRHQARAELFPIAFDYVATHAPNAHHAATATASDAIWIVGGHQPELFHPGVWFKNVLIDALAKEMGGVGLHAIVDHDLARATSIKVPALDAPDQPLRIHTVPLPIAGGHSSPLPWNALRLDPSSIARTSLEIQRCLQTVGVNNPIALSFFRDLMTLPTEWDVATAFSRIRQGIEARHGLRNVELPITRLCRTQSWNAFVHHCLVHSEDLHTIYNRCLHDYREQKKISNPTQPVPPLLVRGDWIELPFWLQIPGDPTRHRVWVRRSGPNWQIGCYLSDSHNPSIVDWNADAAPSAVQGQPPQDVGVCIWPRALMTTLFLRTFVADLFVHGIGGGLYDQLTDAILEQFLGIDPLAFVTCTASMWLDIKQPTLSNTEAWERQAEQLERERQQLRSQPELYLNNSIPVECELKTLHEAMLARMPPRGQKKVWHQQIGQLKSRIAEQIAPAYRDWAARSASHQSREYELRTAQSREYSFLLFEEQSLMDQLTHLAQAHGASLK